jgi:hypothetical protein
MFIVFISFKIHFRGSARNLDRIAKIAMIAKIDDRADQAGAIANPGDHGNLGNSVQLYTVTTTKLIEQRPRLRFQ